MDILPCTGDFFETPIKNYHSTLWPRKTQNETAHIEEAKKFIDRNTKSHTIVFLKSERYLFNMPQVLIKVKY